MISKEQAHRAQGIIDTLRFDVRSNPRLVDYCDRLERIFFEPESNFAPGDWVVRKRDMGAMKPALVTHVEYDPLVEQFKVWFTAPEKGNTRNAYQYELEAVDAPERTPAKLNAQ